MSDLGRTPPPLSLGGRTRRARGAEGLLAAGLDDAHLLAEHRAACKRIKELEEIVDRIMTQHWDMAACTCWVCQSGREADCGPRERYLRDGLPKVRVDWVGEL